MCILMLKNASYKYQGTNKMVLKNINMMFSQGKVYGIIGKSGAGKSTFLSLVSGLDIASEGSVYYSKKDMQTLNRNLYRSQNIGVIFQGYNLLLNATAVENIVLSLHISKSEIKDKKQHAYGVLNKVGIDRDTADRKILKLSGGEQQRVGIARALSHNPDIIIADEPTGNLDHDTEDNILNILASLAHVENKCVIIVSHSKKISQYSDELWGLNQGKLVFVK